MKLTSMLLLGTATLLTSALALANHDMTYLSLAKSHETKQMSIDLPAGKSVVEAWEEKDATISCTFLQRGTNQVVYQANNVGRCVGRADLVLPTTMIAKITNEGTKDAYIRVWVHSGK